MAVRIVPFDKSTTKPDDKGDALLLPLAFIGAFCGGAGLVLIIALAGRNAALRDELLKREAQPQVIVVRD